MVSSSSAIFFPVIYVVKKPTGEFASLEEPTDDSDIAIVLASLADRSGFVGSER
jgi:hypothetical protein